MPDQNQPTDPSQNPVPGGTRPVLTTEEVGTPPQDSQTQDNIPVAPTIPTIPEDGATLPPLNSTEATDTVIPPGPQTTTPSFDMPTVAPAPPKKKFGGKRVVSTILGLLLLIGGLGVGVSLVKEQQDIRSQARECVDESCAITTKTTPNGATVYWYDSRKADSAKTDTKSILKKIPELEEKTNDGKKSASVIIKTPTKTTTETTTGGQTTTGGTTSTTGGIGTGTSTTTTKPTATSSSAPSTAQCLNIKAYDTAFNLLTVDNLKTLEAGDIVRFAVSGNAASGSFDKARFKINSGSFLPETTAKKPGTQEFYYEYTIPDGVTSFNITAQIHHSTLGWSN